MHSRREFLIVGAGALLSINLPASAQERTGHGLGATAVTQVFGDGVRLTAVAVEYHEPIAAGGLSPSAFTVEGRTVTDVFASTSADPADRVDAGRFVIVALAPEDEGALLAERVQAQGGGGEGGPPAGGGPGQAGDIPTYDTVYRDAEARVGQTGTIATLDGDALAASGEMLATSDTLNLVVDDFRQLQFNDREIGDLLRYNLFVPKDYDASRSYPLVLFMHDAGATSDVTRTTLYQGLGAVIWASPQDQAERPCFVLAPQYAEIIADDDSRTSSMMETTIHLIEALAQEYAIDRDRLYVTGQSGGCMMSIAMDIAYPGLFAASFLVAGQWNPALVAPLARQKLFIVVSQDDSKAWPGQNSITAVLEQEGARVNRAVWDARWNAEEFRTAFDEFNAEGSPINYVAFGEGTVIPEGESTAGASGHRNTWRVAYTIEPVREWIFRQQR
ncbi:MAG: peptidase [Mesorhizobium sp.]|uniref:carboxylesterase family protein n=1 Tax=Mesorhizobium sp. TaxID=1871066 RepID=UPI00120CF08A|nr:hypothetical protein [Mesorhizobium sp.]TIM31128.1 MAG: peptidase [Mesorhizobium sp.]